MGKKHPTITLVHAFDAHAGAQRVAAALATILRDRGFGMRLWLGFGDAGFVSEAWPDWRFLPTRKPVWRKLLYPFWLVAINLAMVGALLRGDRVWANSVAAVPAAGPFLLLAPKRLIIHLHEDRLPWIADRVIRWAGSRGAQLLAVSDYHAEQLGVTARVLRNAVGYESPPPPPDNRSRLVFVGAANAKKGFPLFLSVVDQLRGRGPSPHAFLAGGPDMPAEELIAQATACGVSVTIGEVRSAVHHANSFLLLQLTDPALWDETFSLVAAEALWHLVPVGGAGSSVLYEVAGGALAFNFDSRDPVSIADAILALWGDRDRYSDLVAAADQMRPRFALDRFANEVMAIAGGRHG